MASDLEQLIPSGNEEAAGLDRSLSTPLGQKQGEDEIGVHVSIDCYDAVAVSAFGGIRCFLPIKHEGDDKPVTLHIHPWVMFFMVWPLGAMQIMLILFLRADVKMDAPVREGEGMEWQLSHNRLLQSQIVAILVVFGMVFKKLGDAVILFCFLLNPFTWIEIKRPNPELMRPFGRVYNSTWLAPPALMAIGLKILVAYLVCVESISIILECKTPKDSVFNSLVILFLIDLDASYWGVIQTFFRFSDFDAFTFKSADEKLQKKLTENALRVTELFRNALQILSRKRKGLVTEQLFTAGIIIFVYMRQLAIVLYALDHNVIPSALDVCTQWRMEHYVSKSSLNRLYQQVIPALEAKLRLETIPNHLNSANGTASFDMWHCTDDRYHRMHTTAFFQTLWNHPTSSLTVLGALLTTLIFPVLAGSLKFKSCFGSAEASELEKGDQELDRGTLKGEVQNLKEEMQELRAAVEKMKEKERKKKS